MKTRIQTVFYASILFVSLHLVVGSCEKELPEAGEKIPVRFLLQQASYGEGESLTRSSASGTGEEVSSVVPLGDNLYLHASLEVAPPEPTRAALTLNPGAQIIVAAYADVNIAATASAVYEVNGSAFIPYNSGPELMIEPGNYTFVAYSYNSSVPLTHSTETVSLSPTKAGDGDFLWGTITASVSAGSNAITITMYRKLSRASVKLTTPSTVGPSIRAISNNITIGPGHNVDMKLSDGSFTSTEDDISQPVTLLTSTFPSSLVETEPRLVCTNGSPTTTVTIGSITVGGSEPGRTYTNLTASFSKPLEPNKSYILRVDLKRGVAWAGSNVYWDDTNNTLTFKPYGYVGNEIEKAYNYQGVFFKWGSLVGLSPLKSPAVNWNTDANIGPAHYHPIYNASTGENSWSKSYGGSWTNETNIPFMSANSFPVNINDIGGDKDYFGILIERDDEGLPSTKALYAEGRGDICRYLSEGSGGIGVVSGNYRMPTTNELLLGILKGTGVVTIAFANWTSTTTIHGNWTRIGSTSSPSDWTNISSTVSTDATGRYTDLKSGGNYSGYATFPASGYRSSSSGQLTYVGSQAYYWASSAYTNDSYAGGINFNSSYIASLGNASKSAGYPVRCVLEE